MDTIQHAAAGYVMALATEQAFGPIFGPEHSVALGVGAAVAGALPDLIGLAGLALRKNWALHVSAHSGAIAKWLKLMPPYALHIILDEHLHADGQRWWIPGERLHYELLGWFTVVISWGLLQ